MTYKASISREFGDKAQFAISCVHEPFGSEPRYVYGRMCIRSGDKSLGDFHEPACMLNVTASHLHGVLERLPNLSADVFSGLGEASIWETIDRAIYRNDDRPMEEIVADAGRFFQYDFLTNGGESFDKSKSFIFREDDKVSILFIEDDKVLDSIVVSIDSFYSAVKGFLDWIDSGGTS